MLYTVTIVASKETGKEFYVCRKNTKYGFSEKCEIQTDYPGWSAEKIRAVRDVRANAKIVKQLNDMFDDATKELKSEPIPEVPKRVLVDKIMGMDLYLDVPTSSYVVVRGSEEFPATVDGFAEIIKGLSEVKKLSSDVSTSIASVSSVPYGSRVLLWGPTGTGKTYQFHALAKKLQEDGNVDIVEKVTVTDGFEDTDFLAYIHPNASGGLTIKEKSIVNAFREAANGKKIAVCIDEINRGSRSFMNFILTFIDGVDGEFYVLNNFLNDEKIVIPMENVIFYATMNLGNRYSGTSSLDDALKDRFSRIDYVSYNTDNELDIIIKGFGEENKDTILAIVNYIREVSRAGDIGGSISTRGLKAWAEAFMNSLKTKEDIFKTFAKTILYRIINVDDMGEPNKDEILQISKKFNELGLLEIQS